MKLATVALLGVVAVASACHPRPKERAAVRRWLLCEECREGERDAVTKLGDNVVGVLGEALAGPPASGRQNIRLQAEAMFARIPDTLVQRPAYVEHFVSNYVATYQSRAAIALGLIGSARAHQILLEALSNDSIPYREDVLGAIGASAVIAVSPEDGNPQDAPIDSFVRVNPTVVAIDSSDSAAPRRLANLRVVFQVLTGGGRVLDSVQHTSTNGTATVRWQLGPGVDSVNVLLALAAGVTVRFRATGRGLDPRVVFVRQPRTVAAWRPIVPPVRVAVLDAWGQIITTFGGLVSLSVTDPAAIGLTVIDSSSGADTLVAGEVAFSRLMLNLPGTGLQLIASVHGATQAYSAPFDILP